MSIELAQATSAGKKPTEYDHITMEDGTTKAFPKTYRVIREMVTNGHGPAIAVHFRNGQSLYMKVPEHLVHAAAAAGYSSKTVDAALLQKVEGGGKLDDDDLFEAVSERHAALSRAGSDWNATRGEGVAGAGIVVRAIMRVKKQSQEQVREYLARALVEQQAKNPAFTLQALYAALAKSKALAETIAALKAERAARAASKPSPSGVDGDAVLEGL